MVGPLRANTTQFGFIVYNYIGLGGLSCLATNPCRKKWDGSFCGCFSSEEILLAKDFAKTSILGRKWKWLDKH